MQYREGILIGSACEAGEIFDAVVRNRSDAELDRLAAFYDYFEIQPLCNNHFLINDGKARDEEDLREFNRRVLALGRRLGKLVVATGDVHFLEPEDEIYRHILMASRKFPDADKPLPLYFKTTDEMLKEFSYLGEADCRDVVVTAPNAIADSVESFELLPKDLFPPSIPHAAEDLERMVWDKTHELYGENRPSSSQRASKKSWTPFSAVTTRSFICPRRSSCRTRSSTATLSAAGEALAPPWWRTCPVSRK